MLFFFFRSRFISRPKVNFFIAFSFSFFLSSELSNVGILVRQSQCYELDLKNHAPLHRKPKTIRFVCIEEVIPKKESYTSTSIIPLSVRMDAHSRREVSTRGRKKEVEEEKMMMMMC